MSDCASGRCGTGSRAQLEFFVRYNDGRPDNYPSEYLAFATIVAERTGGRVLCRRVKVHEHGTFVPLVGGETIVEYG